MQRLACSVNAAFRTRFATAHARNVGFSLQQGSKQRRIKKTRRECGGF